MFNHNFRLLLVTRLIQGGFSGSWGWRGRNDVRQTQLGKLAGEGRGRQTRGSLGGLDHQLATGNWQQWDPGRGCFRRIMATLPRLISVWKPIGQVRGPPGSKLATRTPKGFNNYLPTVRTYRFPRDLRHFWFSSQPRQPCATTFSPQTLLDPPSRNLSLCNVSQIQTVGQGSPSL